MNAGKAPDWRKLLIYSHRWLGIVLGIVFLSWCVSGILFAYWGEPHLTAQERLARMQPLDLSRARLTPAEAARGHGISSLARLRIAMLRGRPVYRFQSGRQWKTVYADTGELMAGMTAHQATKLLRELIPEHAATIEYDAFLSDSDQWTLESTVRDLLPLHRIALGDSAGTHYYISDVTGEPVMRTDTNSRIKGYLSARLHWGALRLSPFDFLGGTPPSPALRDAVAGGPVDLEALTLNRLRAVAAAVSLSFTPKELDFLQFRNKAVFYFLPATVPRGSESSSKHEPFGLLFVAAQ